MPNEPVPPSHLASPPTAVRRIVYCGTPEIAVPPLRRLHEAGFEIDVVLTGEDKRRGRGSKFSSSPVKLEALELGLRVSHDPADLALTEADLGVVVAYGRIIRTSVLKVLPMVNLHFSLLPRWRGAAPVERAILAGDAETGVCLMALAPKLDTGDIYATQRVDIDSSATLGELRSELVELGSEMLVSSLQDGLGKPAPQVGESSYAAKIAPTEYELDFTRPAIEIIRVVRLGSAWTTFREKRLKVLAASILSEPPSDESNRVADLPTGAFDGSAIATPNGAVQLWQVQPAGKNSMSARDWLNGVQPEVGEHFG